MLAPLANWIAGRSASIRLIAAETRFSLSRLVPAADTRRFADQSVPAIVLAKRFNLNTRRLAYA
jgi:hypothetical protein